MNIVDGFLLLLLTVGVIVGGVAWYYTGKAPRLLDDIDDDDI